MSLLKHTDIKVFIWTGAILSLVILILILLKTGNNNRLNRELNRLKSTIENVRTLTGDIERFNRGCEEMQQKYKLVSEKIPREAQIPQTIGQLTSAVEGLKLKIVSIIPKERVGAEKQAEEFLSMPGGEEEFLPAPTERQEPEPGCVRIPIEINMRGDYFDIGRYLNNLRYLPRLVTVEEFGIEKVEGGGLLDVQFVVSVYYAED